MHLRELSTRRSGRLSTSFSGPFCSTLKNDRSIYTLPHCIEYTCTDYTLHMHLLWRRSATFVRPRCASSYNCMCQHGISSGCMVRARRGATHARAQCVGVSSDSTIVCLHGESLIELSPAPASAMFERACHSLGGHGSHVPLNHFRFLAHCSHQ